MKSKREIEKIIEETEQDIHLNLGLYIIRKGLDPLKEKGHIFFGTKYIYGNSGVHTELFYTSVYKENLLKVCLSYLQFLESHRDKNIFILLPLGAMPASQVYKDVKTWIKELLEDE